MSKILILLIFLFVMSVKSEKNTETENDNPDKVTNDEITFIDFSKDDKKVHLSKSDFVRAEKRPVADEKIDREILLRNNLVEGDIAGFTHEEFKDYVTQQNQKYHWIKTGRLQGSALGDPLKRWPNAIIPYYVSAQYTQEARAKLAEAVQEYHKKTCVRFVPRTTQFDYIYIKPQKDYICSSVIGRTGGEQLLTLGKGCFGKGTVLHEIMHVLGFFHEQSRFDRDNFVRVAWENINPKNRINFQKYPIYMTDFLQTSYDYGSIMHYGSKYFSFNGKDTIIPLSPGVTIGQTIGFSPVDLDRINRLYDCKNKAVSPTSPSPRTPAPPLPVWPTDPLWPPLGPQGFTCEGCQGCPGCKGCPGCPDCPDCPPCAPCHSVNGRCPVCPTCPRCPQCPQTGCQQCPACPVCPCGYGGSEGASFFGWKRKR